MDKEQNNRILTFDRKEAARLLGVSVVTIDRELARKRLPHFRVGRRVLFTEALLDSYIAQNTLNSSENASFVKNQLNEGEIR